MKAFRSLALLLALCLLLPAFAGCQSSAPKEETGTDAWPDPAVWTENYTVTASMIEYFFNSYYRAFVGDNSTRLSGLKLDVNRALEEQAYNEEYSWFDFFSIQTLQQVRQLLYVNEEARAAGLSLTEEDLGEIEDTLLRYDAVAAQGGMPTAYYLKTIFGQSVNETTVRKCLQLQLLASRYTEYLEQEKNITDADLEAFFSLHSKEYVFLDLIRATVADDAAAALVDAADDAAFAASLREALAAKNPDADPAEIDAQVNAAYVHRAAYVEGAEFSEWAFDPARIAYETYTAPAEAEGQTIVYMLLPADPAMEAVGEVIYRDNTPVKNLKYIFFDAGTYGGTDAAHTLAAEAQEQWAEDTADEAAFDRLMEQYGGSFVEKMERGRVPADLEAWIFDGARKAGDSTLIDAKEGSYLLYMLADGDLQWKVRTRGDLLQEDLDALLEECAEKYDAKFDPAPLYDITVVSLGQSAAP